MFLAPWSGIVFLDFDTWFNRYDEGRVSIPWYNLQTSLRNLLAPEIVRVNHRCVDISEKNASIEVDCISNNQTLSNPFAHWEIPKAELNKTNATDKLTDIKLSTSKSSLKQFQAKLVVAADGINSTIRQILYGNSELNQWAKPQYSGFVAIGCLQIDNVSQKIIQELEDKYFQDDKVVTLYNDSRPSHFDNSERPRLILICRADNALAYLLHAPFKV